MSVPIVYATVVLIWGTTPLAIKASNTGFDPIHAAALRLVLALIVMSLVIALFRGEAALRRAHWRHYAAGSLGLFPYMLLIYSAAEYLPSGLLPVVLAMTPLVTGALSIFLLRDNPFGVRMLVGFGLALSGLALVCVDQLSTGPDVWKGLVMMGIATVVFSLSNVLLKRLPSTVAPLEQALGSMALAVPSYALISVFYTPSEQSEPSHLAVLAVLYLALIGSIVGFVCFFYLLHRVTPTQLSMLTLVSPVLAIVLGNQLAGEPLTDRILLGTALILSGLAIYEICGIWRRLARCLGIGIKERDVARPSDVSS